MSYLPVEAVLDALSIEIRARKGDEREALCPYHEDNNPSWSISVENGFHHCFSCKSGGNLVQLVQHVSGMSWSGARAFIDEIKEEQTYAVPIVRERAPKLHRFELPDDVEVSPVSGWIPSAREYVLDRLPEKQATRWRIGYAVSGRLAGRIVLPIRDEGGQVQSYVARTFTGDKPKYLTPNEEREHPGHALFGQEFWRGHSAVVITEAAFDALAAERVLGGRAAVAAVGGVDLTPMKLAKLRRFDRIVIATDADKAGDEAAAQLESLFGRHATVVRARPAAGAKDLDAMVEADRALLLSSALV